MPRNRDRAPDGRKRVSAAMLQLVLGVICALLGALLYFVPEVDAALLSYILCAVLAAAGVAAVAYYFVTGGYRRMEDYGFALGVLLLALGCCGFARIAEVEAAFSVYLGFAALLLGVITLQNTVQLRVVGSRAAIAALVCTALILFLALSALMNFRALLDALGYLIFLIAGGLGLVSLAVTAIALHGAAKRAEAPPEPEAVPRDAEDAAPAFTPPPSSLPDSLRSVPRDAADSARLSVAPPKPETGFGFENGNAPPLPFTEEQRETEARPDE